MMNENTIENEIGSIWVVADQFGNKISPVTFQLLGQARKLADELNKTLACILLGHKIDSLVDALFWAGVDIVYKAQSSELKFYQQAIYTDTIVELAKEKQPDMMFLGSTAVGRELAPLVAAGLKTGLSAHCIDLCLDKQGVLEQKIPAYGGLMTIVCPKAKPQMATCAQGVFSTPKMDEKRQGLTIEVPVCNSNSDRIQTLEIVQEPMEGVSIEDASSVVAGGAGARDKAGWDLIKELSKTLNAALGCTRPAVDEGWADLDTMIGQSGKMISPDLYLGVGLSGELQHMVGIMDAKLMIAINNDEKSPVFEQVDYGVVDDCKEFLPVLIEKIKHHKE
jgi:electron transfer flavoprotein alpha subunit